MECTFIILLTLDFHRTFDSIECPFMMKTLDYFNFGTAVKKWVSTFYMNIESAMILQLIGLNNQEMQGRVVSVSPINVKKTINVILAITVVKLIINVITFKNKCSKSTNHKCNKICP